MGAAFKNAEMKMERSHEKGIALVSVLGMLATFMLLTAVIVALSQTQRYTVSTSTQLGDSVYRSESAVNRTIWLLMNDRAVFPDRTLKKESEQLLRRERFQADGQPRFFLVDETAVEVVIRDMNAGITLSGYNPGAAFNFLTARLNDNPTLKQHFDPFRDRLMDYTDSDELLRPNGMECADYETMKLQPLPRNAPLQFREEILWIPGSEYFIRPDSGGRLTDINLIPPRGLRFTAGRPHFFSASLELIQNKCDFTDRELETIAELRQQIIAGASSIEEAFSHYPLWYETLKKQFSFTESAYYTLEAKISPQEKIPSRRLFVSLRLSSTLGEQNIQFYEWIIL